MREAVITGTGAYVPERVVTNAEISERLGEDIDDFVSNVLGIRERRVCSDGESTADLGVAAALRALESAGLEPDEIDLLIVTTDTPEHISPATSSVMHGRLGMKRAGSFDVHAACAGFVTALDVAWKYLRSDEDYRRILVVAPYAMTKFVDQADKKTSTIFADGAGAAVLELSSRPGMLGTKLRADGAYAMGLGVFAGGAAEPITGAHLRSENRRHRLQFVEKYPASVNEDGWPLIVRAVLERVGAQVEDVNLWLWTQVNRSTIEVVMARLGQPMGRAHTIMHKWGYTGAACIPMALDDAVRAGRLAPGDLLVMTGSGAGLTMGSAAIRWDPGARA